MLHNVNLIDREEETAFWKTLCIRQEPIDRPLWQKASRQNVSPPALYEKQKQHITFAQRKRAEQ